MCPGQEIQNLALTSLARVSLLRVLVFFWLVRAAADRRAPDLCHERAGA